MFACFGDAAMNAIFIHWISLIFDWTLLRMHSLQLGLSIDIGAAPTWWALIKARMVLRGCNEYNFVQSNIFLKITTVTHNLWFVRIWSSNSRPHLGDVFVCSFNASHWAPRGGSSIHRQPPYWRFFEFGSAQGSGGQQVPRLRVCGVHPKMVHGNGVHRRLGTSYGHSQAQSPKRTGKA